MDKFTSVYEKMLGEEVINEDAADKLMSLATKAYKEISKVKKFLENNGTGWREPEEYEDVLKDVSESADRFKDLSEFGMEME